MGFFSLFKKEQVIEDAVIKSEHKTSGPVLEADQSTAGDLSGTEHLAVIAAAVYASLGDSILISTIRRKDSGMIPVWGLSGRQTIMSSRRRVKGV
jgi:hypothetical protein